MLAKFLESDYPDDVKDAVHGWLASQHNEKEKADALRKIFDYTVAYNPRPSKMAIRMLGEWHKRMGHAPADIMKLIRPRILFYRTALFRAAAVLVPILIIAGLLLFDRQQAIEPAVVAMVMMAVPDTLGAQARVNLPDGTDVFVRPGSAVSYAEDFNAGDKRRIMLDSGEIYLDVISDSVREFIVETPNLNVNVLGTKFDVEALQNGQYTVVTLYEGRIKVDGINNKHGVTVIGMTPGQRLVYSNTTGEYKIEQTAAMLPDWIAQRLTFRNAPYSEIIRTIEWYYGVTVELDGNLDDNMKLNFRITGQEDIETTMWLFRNVSREFTYEIDGDVVKVKPQV